MSRPRELEKRLDLARRAVEVLRTQGLEISMSDLAKQIGIKRPTLLYHFPSLSHIIETALKDVLTRQAVYVMAQVNQHEHPIDRLYAQIRAVHSFHHGREAEIVFLSQAIATSAGSRMSILIEIGNQVFEPYRQAAIERITGGIKDGQVKPCDPAALIALVRSMIDGLLVQRVMTGIDLEPVHQLLWTQVLRPLKKSKRSQNVS